jgi:hypothetical protein
MPPLNKLEVYIPTRGRIDRQITMKKFFLEEIFTKAPSWLEIYFVVPTCEQCHFIAAHPWTDSCVFSVKDTYKFGSVCQAIAEVSTGLTMLLDDDMLPLRRRDPYKTSQAGATANVQDVLDLFARVRSWLAQGYVHGGISLRQSNHYCTDTYYQTNTRTCGVTFFDARILKTEGIRFDAVEARSDFHVYLSLLELGYKNVCDYEFICGQWSGKMGGSNAPGGCAIYRTPAFLLEQASLLQKLHPRSVKLIYKQRKGEALAALATDEGIPDVRIGWSKAYGIRSHERKYTGVKQ